MNKVSDFASASAGLDLRKRASLLQFIGTHPRYGLDFCQCVKLPRLNIPRDLRDAAYALLETQEPYDAVESLFDAFRLEYGDGSPANLYGGVGNVRVGIDGRSNGYIVLYGTQPIEQPADLDAWSLADLRALARMLMVFDALCDDCVVEFMRHVTDYEFVTVRIDSPVVYQVLQPKSTE